jgi:hypothetical protein
MELFTVFIIVVFVLIVVAVVFTGSGEFGDFQELSASLEQRTQSLNN